MNVTEDEVDLYCVAYNTMFMNPADETCTGLQHTQTIFVWAHHQITVKGKILLIACSRCSYLFKLYYENTPMHYTDF